MKILAADSASVSAAAALYEDGKIISEGFINNGLTHSQTLMPLIDSVIKSAGFSCADIDLFAVTTGPGSFTGVRIGVATVKGLAFATGKPCVSVSSLEAIARTAACFDGIISAAMDARRNQVYNAVFSAKNGNFERLCEDRAIAVPELIAELYEKYSNENVYITGDGAELVLRADEGKKICAVPHNLRYPRGFAVAQTAEILYKQGEILPAARLDPVYLRMPQAERELKNSLS